MFPHVEVYPIVEVQLIERFLPVTFASIHQPFDGAIAGDVILDIELRRWVRLTDLLTDGIRRRCN